MKVKVPVIFLMILILISISLLVYAGAVIHNFRGEPGHNKVTLHWSTLSETNCEGFQIERSLNKTTFEKIGFVKGAGNSSVQKDYKFVDKTVYKPEISRTFYYRLKIINKNSPESIYSQIVSVTPSISGARYTWGSIKALFR